MTEVKQFPTLVVASTLTGISMAVMRISARPECAEWLCGYPVGTHELAYQPIMDDYIAKGYAQFPDMPTKAAAEADFQAAAAKAVAAYGEVLTVNRGTGERSENPIETLQTMTPNEEIIVVTVGGNHA